jgi:hypothetical protein
MFEVSYLGSPRESEYLVVAGIKNRRLMELYNERPIDETHQKVLYNTLESVKAQEPNADPRASVHNTIWHALIAIEVDSNPMNSYETSAAVVAKRERDSRQFDNRLDLAFNQLQPVADAINEAANYGRLSTNMHAVVMHTGGGCMAVNVYNAWALDTDGVHPEDYPMFMITDLDGPIEIGLYENYDDDLSQYDIDDKDRPYWVVTHEDDGITLRDPQAPQIVVRHLEKLWNQSRSTRLLHKWGSYGATS